jgi:hypothetical protein
MFELIALRIILRKFGRDQIGIGFAVLGWLNPARQALGIMGISIS